MIKHHIEDGCPICGAMPEQWEVRERKLSMYDHMKCKVCGSELDIDGTRIYLISKGIGVIKDD